MKIIFATLYDIDDVNRGSGTYHNIYQELIKQKHIVHKIGPLNLNFPFLTKAFRFIAKRLLGMRYRSFQDPFIGKEIGDQVKMEMEGFDYDILLTNDYTIAGYTKIKKPIVLWTDAIFPFNYSKNKHPWLADLPWFCVLFCHKVIRSALNNVNLLIIPSEWSKKRIKEYNLIDDELIKIIPFGSNLKDPGKEISLSRDFNQIINKREIRLLFVGKDWSLKGGELALRIVNKLNNIGIRSILDIVGIEQIDKYRDDKIIFHGMLNKNKVVDMEKLIELYKFSDIFFLPSIAEGFGISYVEAASFGLPSLGYITMGVPTAVKMNRSGVLIKLDDNPEKFIEIITNWMKNPNSYNELALSARKHFEMNGNWKLLISRLIKEINFNCPL